MKEILYTVYKITNNINNKIYIGVHQTTDINDDYMGSGGGIIRSIQKYGVDNFTKETLFIFDNLDDMFDKEKEIVNEEFISRLDTYNKINGGHGRLDDINERGLNVGWYQKSPENSKYLMRGFRKKMQDPVFRNEHNARSIAKLNKWRENNENGFKGKKHTAETIKKMKDAKKGHGLGKNNSQYGTCWIYSKKLNINKQIQKKDLDQWLKDGYIKGRKI